LRSKPATLTLGFLEGELDSKPAISTLGSEALPAEAKPAISTTAFCPGRKSDCGPFSAEIEIGLTSGLSLKRIHQDLVSDHAFTGSYQSVKRFAHKFAASIDPPFRRIECAPGEEMQVDFGSAAWVVEAGRFATLPGHIHPHKQALAERGPEHLLRLCRRLGPACGAWAEAMYRHRGVYGIRSLQGLLHLAKQHPVHALEGAAAQALERACFRLRDLRALVTAPSNAVQLGFLQAHPLIRDLSAYRLAFPT